MKNNFEENKQNRIDRLEARAEKAASNAQTAFKTADDLSQAFWGGQPILVGHHSEGKARRTQEKMHNNMRKGLALDKKAKDLKGRAFSIKRLARNLVRVASQRLHTFPAIGAQLVTWKDAA